jgi:predicted O-methyltransferase YrrM
MNITTYLASKTNRLQVQPEITPHPPGYSMFNSGSTEVEVAEFLYSLVKLVKPERVLETGTHFGVSAAYMGQALKENNKGHMWTLEVMQEFVDASRQLWQDLDVHQWVECVRWPSLDYAPDPMGYELIFLDSEPHLRFDEFVRFWPSLKPGGFILIHDLHPHLGHTNTVVNDMYDWPYGDFRAKLGPYIKAHEVQTVNFRSPRGFTMFQRAADDFGAFQHLTGRI